MHTNSGVLNKWFYLLTAGEVGTNDLGNAYTVAGVDFAKSQKITYLTELTLTSNATHLHGTNCINQCGHYALRRLRSPR